MSTHGFNHLSSPTVDALRLADPIRCPSSFSLHPILITVIMLAWVLDRSGLARIDRRDRERGKDAGWDLKVVLNRWRHHHPIRRIENEQNSDYHPSRSSSRPSSPAIINSSHPQLIIIDGRLILDSRKPQPRPSCLSSDLNQPLVLGGSNETTRSVY